MNLSVGESYQLGAQCSEHQLMNSSEALGRIFMAEATKDSPLKNADFHVQVARDLDCILLYCYSTCTVL
jgi:predicted nucleic acid-binding Zn finger protein